jgi:glycosyltransferase involved in cell wall biosynthesis
MHLINPKITVITVVRNGEKTLEQTMLSVLNQTYLNIEYIVIDGASTDGTLGIIKSYDERIKNGEFPNVSFRWISEPDRGIYNAMNKGIDMATGEWIGIINSGDGYEKSAIKTVASEMIKRPEAGLLFGNMKIIREGHYFRDEVFSGTINVKVMNISHPTVFVRKRIYVRHGKFDEQFRIAADYDLLLRFYQRHIVFQHLNSAIAFFATGGVSSNFNVKILRERYRIRIKNHINPFSMKEIFVYLYCKLPLVKKYW